MADPAVAPRYVWPGDDLTVIPDWVYTDQRSTRARSSASSTGRPGTTSRSRRRSQSGRLHALLRRSDAGRGGARQGRPISVFENRCAHRGAEFCREHSGNAKEFVCPYHQWSYDLKGNLQGIPFKRGVNGKGGGMPADFKPGTRPAQAQRHHPARRGVRLLLGRHRAARRLSRAGDPQGLRGDVQWPQAQDLGYYRNELPGNWKLYHENLKDPYHATLLHSFLVTFGLMVAGNKFA